MIRSGSGSQLITSIGLFAFIIVLGAIGTLWSTIPPSVLSSGAPASSTGAPGEKDCTKSGCHDDATTNVGPALCSIEIGSGQSTYVPNSIYVIRVSVTDTNHHRFGYQLVVLDSGNHNVGELSVSDYSRTQILQNFNELVDREYATYTYAGTSEFSPGRGEWLVNWKAPSTVVGPIHFYAALASANNDNTDKGDQIYNVHRQLNPLSSGGISYVDEPALALSPNPIHTQLLLSRLACFSRLEMLQIVDMNGRIIRSIAQADGIPEVLDCQSLCAGRYQLVLMTNAKPLSIGFVKQ